jgi:hypothetical protein
MYNAVLETIACPCQVARCQQEPKQLYNLLASIASRETVTKSLWGDSKDLNTVVASLHLQ